MRRRGRKDDVEYQTLVEQVPAVVYVGSSEGTGVLYISPQVDGMLGYAQEEWFSDPWLWLKILHPEDRERILVNGTHVHDAGESFRTEYRIFTKDGREVRVRDESVPVLDKEERPGLWRGVMLDITERKRAEESLRKSEERHRLVARATNEVIWDSDLLSDTQVWDGAVDTVLGYSAQQVTDTAWWEDHIHPEDRERVSKIEAMLRPGGGETWSDEYRFRKADGTYVVVMDRAYLVRDEATGKPVRMVGSMADVTEKRRMEAEVRESEERFRLAFEATNVGMAHATPDGRWLRVNAKMCEILGRERENFMGMKFQDLTPPEDLDAAQERVNRMLDGKLGPYTVERRFVRKDGSRVWVSLEVSLVRKRSSEPDYLVCAAKDITSRKLAELIPDPLTPGELVVLELIARWHRNREIAQKLNYSESMIKVHVRHILRKLGVKRRNEAVLKAVELGLISLPR